MLKGALIFAGGAVVGGVGASAFWLFREKKEAQRHESEIAELKVFYGKRAEDQARIHANDLVKRLMANGYLVKGQSSLDNPELVTKEVIEEIQRKEAEESDDSSSEEEGSGEAPSPETRGADPPKERKNLFDTHGLDTGHHPEVDAKPGPKEASLIRDRWRSGLTDSEIQEAFREGVNAAKQDGHYTRYSAYSRSNAKRETSEAVKAYFEEQEIAMIEDAATAQFDEAGTLVDEEGPDEATVQHVAEAPTEKPDHPIIITRGQFENEYPLYEKEVFIVYLLDGIMCREDGEVIEDPFLYIGLTEPVSLWPGNWEEVGAATLFVRNHRLGIDIQVMPLFRSYAEDMANGGEF